MVIEICQICGDTFDGALHPYARLCSTCRKKILSETAKQRKLNVIGRNARLQKLNKNQEVK